MSSPSGLSNPDDSAYQHASASRPNQPTSETAPLMDDHQRAPEAFHAGRRFPAGFADVYADAVKQQAPHLNKDLSGHPLLAWDRSGATSVLTGDTSIDEVHGFAGSPLFTREKVTPALLLEQLRRPGGAAELQLDFDGLDEGADEYDWYRHSGRWQNRLIHGDSAAVMQSLIAKDRMAGQVQMIYFDPPYGMGFKSNFQTATKKLETPEKLDGVPVGDTLPLRAFRDSYRNGIHSYLDGIHERAVLARELLTDTGSLFVQIGDENVHRLALVLDEVFGPENRVATITWRPTGSSSARTLPETASYLLWYAKDKALCKYNPVHEEFASRRELVDQFGLAAMVTECDGTVRNLTRAERQDADGALPNDATVWRRMPMTSMGSSRTGRTREIIYRGERYHCGDGRHWCGSRPKGDPPRWWPPRAKRARPRGCEPGRPPPPRSNILFFSPPPPTPGGPGAPRGPRPPPPPPTSVCPAGRQWRAHGGFASVPRPPAVWSVLAWMEQPLGRQRSPSSLEMVRNRGSWTTNRQCLVSGFLDPWEKALCRTGDQCSS
ncbi:MAG: site-specific DNA-methyltransferase [Acidimicrobiaceae bacterium]|nr:site-specific DNA-methyltransferase [Acidimicrobiaceae bacterium]